MGEASEGLVLDCPVSSVCCIGVSEGAYVYMAHLRAIDGKRPEIMVLLSMLGWHVPYHPLIQTSG